MTHEPYRAIRRDLDTVLMALLDGTLDDPQRRVLERAIIEDPQIRAYCQDYFLTHAAVRRSSLITGEWSQADLVAAVRRTAGVGRRRLLRWGTRAAVVTALVGLVAWWSGTQRGPAGQGPVCGRVTAQSQARWQRPWHRLGPGDAVHQDRLVLREGTALVTLEHGAAVLLQAPACLALVDGNRLRLESGRLTATVPASARGFQVLTAQATLTDRGTRFGVIAEPNGTAECHVFEGRVDVTSAGQAASLGQEQAIRIGPARGALQALPAAEPRRFLLDVPPPAGPCPGRVLNLADLIGGGNGYGSGRPEVGIDLVTGEVFDHVPARITRVRDGGYRGLPNQYGIDGVFVPNGLNRPVLCTSSHAVFEDCPVTRGSYYAGVTNTAKITSIEQPDRIYVARFGGQVLGTPDRPVLSLHPNAGITFDLDDLRREHPAQRLTRLTAVAGISDDLQQPRRSDMDFWILLDGTVVRHLNFPRPGTGHHRIAVDIPATARFLTLAATSPGDAGYNWFFLSEPYLHWRPAGD